ncbi:hypothetical protein PH5382_01464 [Phaeobacter sp. CECT 5382]|uniref:hypothetical protein n=1 Tax=Rhodobacterales TaxID=204455 RepID=UPI0006DBC220|nr:hypothetical protein [Phaeobacter sp. CECT 5382]CUH87535.1 hypothetical protein PH5382_01464 [Phaeobacter sp. CECT 5382]
MKPSAMILALCACLMTPLAAPQAAAKEGDITQVTVLGRIWHVSPVAETPGLYRANRQNAELLPFRPPAVLSVRQAIRAFRGATGCSVNLDSMYRTISGPYYATLICP